MELRVLKYFLMAAREENITKAAELLHVTQPTLSRQLMQLEEELGVKLFQRSNHRIVLTEDGIILKQRAQEILLLADKTKRDFLCKGEELSGEINIGSGEFQTTKFLSELIASFRARHPFVRYEIYSGNAGNISDYIERGLLDLGLMMEPIDIRKYDFIQMPQKEKWGVLVRADSKLADKESVHPEDLLDTPLITATSDFVQSRIQKWFGEYSHQTEIVATGNLLYNQAMMAESNIGIVICIELSCSYENLRFIPLYPGLESTSVLAWKKEQIFSPATTAFIEHAEKYVKGISENKI
ncbi:MAG: LysR family transcriptional regulator [Muricomes sp.]